MSGECTTNKDGVSNQYLEAMAIYAERQGMEAENEYQTHNENPPEYRGNDFFQIAEKFRALKAVEPEKVEVEQMSQIEEFNWLRSKNGRLSARLNKAIGLLLWINVMPLPQYSDLKKEIQTFLEEQS